MFNKKSKRKGYRKSKSYKKFYIALVIVSMLVFFISMIAKNYPQVTEYVYSRFIYKIISQPISLIFGIFPFSTIEILLYAIVLFTIIFTMYSIIRTLMNIFRKEKQPFKPLLNWLLIITSSAMIIYSSFNIMWSFNYARKPFSEIAGWEVSSTPVSELYDLTVDLAKKCNDLRKHVKEDEKGVMILNGDIKDALKRSRVGYDKASVDFPALKGSYSRPKPVLASEAMCYAGITGMFVPFTFEANVNVKTPSSSLLHTIMHELAHQRGFSREDEANFVGYLACKYHPDVDFQYSGYYHALVYSLNQLFKYDSDKGNEVMSILSEAVLRDMVHEDDFWKQYETPVVDISTKINDAYLKANQQFDGVYSYGRVVDLLLAERREALKK